jgi:LDH2 family malate/lactate/ureidoglycolate dehydrogenase
MKQERTYTKQELLDICKMIFTATAIFENASQDVSDKFVQAQMEALETYLKEKYGE